MAALLMGLEKVTYLVNRCRTYEILHLQNNPSQPASLKAEKNLEDALLAIYSHILMFLAKANRMYEKNLAQRTIHAFLNPNDIVDFIESCEKLESRAHIDASSCECAYDRERNTEFMQKLRQSLANLDEPIIRIDSRVFTMFEKLKSVEQSSILQWISSIPYEDNHKTASQGRTEGTGKWLLQHQRYLEWRKSSASMILWLHGFREFTWYAPGVL